ncbi:uracil-DNA glycosylase [Sporosarcina sp. 179-K 3D1 HS]|uniref:uracil-DNA glycosylase n=1 Tax=Sporosarcina sp. 179-K 3D1 HS TaxID=3232169 RepID=UPI00399F1BC8
MNLFCPEIWLEELPPESEKNCQECGLFEHGTRMVWGEGNPEAPIMAILDNPGARENREGEPMICGTRQTLQQAAYEAGLTKDSLYVTYVLKRKPIRAYDKEKVRHICSRHLTQQMEKQQPRLVLCLGNVAVQTFFQNLDAEVKRLRGSWYDVRGYRTTAAYHPLAARRRPNLYPLLVQDLELVAAELGKLNSG